MGTNNPNLPSNVLSDEEAIQYLSAVVQAQRMNTVLPVTVTGVIPAANIPGGFVDATGAGGITLTTDTAVAIIAFMNTLATNGGAVNSTFSLTIANDTAGTVTVSGGVGVTIVGTVAAIVAGFARRYIGRVLTGTTVQLTGL